MSKTIILPWEMIMGIRPCYLISKRSLIHLFMILRNISHQWRVTIMINPSYNHA
ncbi:unnamed protein product [Brassica rapa subsp. trilocularis]